MTTPASWRIGMFLTTAVVLASAASPALACSCIRGRTLADFIERADLVVHARIVAVEDILTPERRRELLRLDEDAIDDFLDDEAGYGLRVRYDALTVLKGDPARHPEIRTGYDDGDCGVAELPGRELLIFVSANGSTGLCAGTREYEVRSCAAQAPLTRLATMIATGAIDPAFTLPDEPGMLEDETADGDELPYRGPESCVDDRPVR